MSVLAKPYGVRDDSEITTYPDFAVEFRASSHRYWLHHDGERTPAVSVTSALGVLDKPALRKWYGKMDAEATLTLERSGQLNGVAVEDVIGVVRSLGLGAEAKRDAGADRGTAVHEALRIYCEEGTVPSLADFPEEVRGYVQAACGWLVASSPEPIAVERIVGSATHGYAGRMDLRAKLDGRDVIVDFKSNPGGRVYLEAHLQVRAYAMADVECGNPEPEGAVIVALGEDGSYEQSECCAGVEDWLSVLSCHRRVAGLRNGLTAQRRNAEAA